MNKPSKFTAPAPGDRRQPPFRYSGLGRQPCLACEGGLSETIKRKRQNGLKARDSLLAWNAWVKMACLADEYRPDGAIRRLSVRR
jgi:hypothetical protein